MRDDVSSESPRLLLAEDDPLQTKILAHMLSRAGYAVDTALSGEEALTKVLAGAYQILVTDWDMPGMDGATLCHRIRQAQLPGYLYILMLTAHSSVSDIVAGLEAGADDYLRKPADDAELLARLKAGRRIVDLERSLSAANARAERLSVTDALLDCSNRRYLNEQLPREIERSQRYDSPLAIILADLDHFKKINDSHGHAAGDEVLVEFVRRARSTLRQASDWIARYGGEEFAIVLPNTDGPGALAAAEKIRELCATTPFHTGGGPLHVTASFGIADLRRAGDVKEAMRNLLHAADSALYLSKDYGRNRATLAGTS
jgi:two-component system, cell cycle response regulator